jgi:hypothetical protein
VRLKASVWVGAYIRQLNAIPVPAIVARLGDQDAGAIFIKINTLDGNAQILRPAILGSFDDDGRRYWTPALKDGPKTETDADAYLARQADFDTDMWIIEVEDREGRHFLDDSFIAE